MILILVVVVVIVLLVLFWTTTTSKRPPPPPVFLQAQKGGRQRQKWVKDTKGGSVGAKGPALFKAPAQSSTPGPKKGNYSMIPGLCSDEACVKRITDMRGKNITCEAGDEYCVFAKGATGQGCINNGTLNLCMPGLPTRGNVCKYTDKDCIKAVRPDSTPGVNDVLEACTDTTLEQCTTPGSCVHYTCKTKEDAQRVSAKNAQLVCKSDQVVKCDTEGNTAFCGCFPYYLDEHGNKGCPDGMVKKGIRIPCKGGPKNYIKSIRVPACKPMIRSYYICELPQTLSPPPPTPGFEAPPGCVDVSTGGCKASKTCLEYKCKTREDMERVDETNVKMTCGKDTTLKCRRFYEEPYENEVRCNCEEILPSDYDGKPCPDGLVVKNKRNFYRSIPGLPYDVCARPGGKFTRV